MKERILNDLKDAMKSQDKELLVVIRMVKGAIQMEELNLKRELNDDEVISIIGKQIKSRKESIVEFEKGNRQDLIDKTQSEIEILNKYMPAQLTDEELNKIINEVFENMKPSGIKDMGKVIGAINPLVKGKADMALVSKIVKEKLNN